MSAKQRDFELSQLPEEERQAWRDRRIALGSFLSFRSSIEEAEQQALLDAVKNGQRIVVDVGYQETMSDLVGFYSMVSCRNEPV